MPPEQHPPTTNEILTWATESAEAGDFEPALLVEDALRRVVTERADEARANAVAWTDLESRVQGTAEAPEEPEEPVVPETIYPHSIVFNFINPFYDAENRALEPLLSGGLYNSIQREIRDTDHGRNAHGLKANRNHHDIHFFPQGVTILEPSAALSPASRMGLIRHFGEGKIKKFAAFVIETTRTKTFPPEA